MTLTTETDNGKYVCFWIKDNEGDEPNITAAISQQVQGIDVTVPTITVTNPASQVAVGGSRTFSATVTDPTPSGLTDADNPVTFQYGTITPASTGDAATCDDAVPSGATSYTSGDDIVFSDEADNNKWVCFWATDAAGNVGKANTDKIANLDTRGPTITVTMVGLQPTAVETRARLVKATATDASPVSMWYEIQSGPQCAASPFQADGTTLRQGVSVYAGSYDANTDTFTPDRAVVVRENDKRVCFWAQDGTTPPNVVSGVSGLTSGVVGREDHADDHRQPGPDQRCQDPDVQCHGQLPRQVGVGLEAGGIHRRLHNHAGGHDGLHGGRKHHPGHRGEQRQVRLLRRSGRRCRR